MNSDAPVQVASCGWSTAHGNNAPRSAASAAVALIADADDDDADDDDDVDATNIVCAVSVAPRSNVVESIDAARVVKSVVAAPTSRRPSASYGKGP